MNAKRNADIPVRESKSKHGLENPSSVKENSGEDRAMSDANLLIKPLPTGWENHQFADVCDRVKDSHKPVEGGSTPYVGLEHLAQGFPAFVGRGTESDIKSSKTAFKIGDILFGKLRPYLRKGTQADFEGISSTDILVFRAAEICESDFLKYLIHSDEFIGHAQSTTSGVQHPRTSWPSLREFRLSLPPLPEQKKIAHILSTVQRAIEAQERIIQTTTELKKALMHKLFTEGLRNEPQKQTEIGLVPKSWEVLTVQDLVDRNILDKPIDGNHGEIHPKVSDFVPEGIPFIMASDLKGGSVNLKTCNFITKERADRLRKGFSLPGDVLISHKATIGETAIVPEIEHYIMLTPQVTYYRVLDRDALSNQYLRCYFDSPTFQKPLKNVAGDGSTRAYIGITKQRGLPVLLPEIDEQRELADVSGRLDEKIRQAIAKKNAFSDLFRTLLHEMMKAKTRVHKHDFPQEDIPHD
ncbi:Type I restriction enzyme EcoKI specificity protein [Thiorhodovibrio winogradskyi]|uniref:Type I restriction enzyme EcoKI specificity protein n=1 Tax=Thiorhodovibrio winogradskyi TaxID=77007 RepID=A0ABZ0SDH9_9GAMM|nr:restriction endonuclease subunit S [Thiorhodovibrio winogradskyi]